MEKRKTYFIPQNEEHIEKLCDDLITWAEKTDTPIIADFLSKEKVPWSILRKLIDSNEKVELVFELSITYLVVKWYEKAKNGKMGKPMMRLLSRYIDAYDLHLFYVDTKKRKILADKLASLFEEKNWAKQEIPEPFKSIYEENQNN